MQVWEKQHLYGGRDYNNNKIKKMDGLQKKNQKKIIDIGIERLPVYLID